MDGLIFVLDQTGRSLAQAMQRIDAMAAEIERLTAENERLRQRDQPTT